MNNIIFGIGMVTLFTVCLGYSISRARKSKKYTWRINTWYVFFPDKDTAPDLTKSKNLKKLGKWNKTGKQLYSIKGNATLTKEEIAREIKQEYEGIKFDISNTSELYAASWCLPS